MSKLKEIKSISEIINILKKEDLRVIEWVSFTTLCIPLWESFLYASSLGNASSLPLFGILFLSLDRQRGVRGDFINHVKHSRDYPFQIPPCPPFLKGGTRRISIFKGILPTHFHNEPIIILTGWSKTPICGVSLE